MQTCDSMDIGDIWDKSLQLFLCVIYTKVSLLEYCGVFPPYLAVFFLFLHPLVFTQNLNMDIQAVSEQL